MPRLKGRTALITGGAGAIGLAAARRNNHTAIWTGSEMERVRERLLKTWRQASSPAVEPGVPPGGQTANVARPIEKSSAGPGGETPATSPTKFYRVFKP